MILGERACAKLIGDRKRDYEMLFVSLSGGYEILKNSIIIVMMCSKLS